MARHMRFAIVSLFAVVENQATNPSVIAATTPRNTTTFEAGAMSKIDVEYGLDDTLKSKDRVFVLFYASWCPFSQSFLPKFDNFAREKTQSCLRVKTDDKASHSEQYSVDVVPTVLFFENGKLTKRLDGIPGAGLSEKQFADFVNRC
jgi:thioredoxin-like negative regulator of GroEL